MKNENKQQKAYRIIKLRIIERIYVPGQRLVIDQLAREMETSSIPIREAIRQLEAEKLIYYKKNIGPVVARVNETDYSDTLRVLAVLEGYATSLSAHHFPQEKINLLTEKNKRMEEALSEFDILLYGKLNLEFHKLINDACQNSFLLEAIEAATTRLDSIRGIGSTLYSVRVNESIKEHWEIIHLLETGDYTELEKIARTHKIRTAEDFEKRRLQQLDPNRFSNVNMK